MPAADRPGRSSPNVSWPRTIVALAMAAVLGACAANAAASPSPLASPLGTSPGVASAVPTGALPTTAEATARPTAVTRGLGIRRAQLMQAVDAAIAPDRFEWRLESTMRDGTPKVEGSSITAIAGVSIMGPADDVIAVQVSGLAVATPEDATIVLAMLQVAVPEAEAWWRSTFDGPPEYQTRGFGVATVGWTRDFFLFDGQQSMLLIAPTAMLPTPSPTPTPTPIPTPVPDLLTPLPTEINGIPVVTRRWTVAELPDDVCYPVCRWQVQALAERRELDAKDIEIVTAEPVGSRTGPVDFAIIRLPPASDRLFPITLDWQEALRSKWPDLFVDSDELDNGRFVDVLRRDRSGLDRDVPAWYVLETGRGLVVVSDSSAKSFVYPPRRRIEQILIEASAPD